MSAFGTRVLAERFAEREDLGHQRFFELYCRDRGCSQSGVFEFLAFVEQEVGIPGGVLRPSDPIDLLLLPPRTRNPLLWLMFQTRAGDIRNELVRALDRHLESAATEADRPSVRTVEDVIRIYCGQRPADE